MWYKDTSADFYYHQSLLSSCVATIGLNNDLPVNILFCSLCHELLVEDQFCQSEINNTIVKTT